MKAQTRKGAAIESAANLAVGFSISYAINYFALPLFGMQPSTGDLFGLGAIFTVVSVIRSFCLRRVFEWLRIRKAPPAFLYIAEDLARERHRQITGEGYSLERDDANRDGELAAGAAAYCLAAADLESAIAALDRDAAWPPQTMPAVIRAVWPFDLAKLKPESRRRCLVKAGAMIIAEIGRLDRAAEMRGVP